MKLETITRRKTRVMKAKRIGRGYGSGVGGHTVGRGAKGQKSRTGHKSLISFEGGNVPFYRRMPKYKGFNNQFKVENATVNVFTLEKIYKEGETVTVESLKEKGIVRKNATSVKILGNGDIKKKIIIEGIELVSSSAREKIEKAGGSIK
ncbi:MAG TPA: 50S ribosomal protein L15 [Candidatus Dojkabacteria bacterium]|nr:50S ribosomal protein L15 [Candidatus Dojkabacteria bacterium]HOR06129.1 50S ribosomal protein L15 [Candidatus Dojkabacteria bacterium]HOT60870.1 50S ribosomal protein L15 [Candidatus Dojkabacteria bacterium]HQI92780.1 50S ribosomal protein L15 [Candidatus Dojkabacteria bacterium]